MDESLARLQIKIRIPDVGETDGELNRLTAPLTVEEIMKMLPISGRIHPIKRGVSLILGIQKGIEKPINRVKAGTMAYWPRGDALQIYYEDGRTRGPVNKIGEIWDRLDIFKKIRLGSRILIEEG